MRRHLLLASLLLAPTTLVGQQVRGKLTVAGGTPVAGAIVTLVDSAGTVAARALSTPLGSYALIAAADGKYTLRVLRVGFPAWSSPPLALAAATPEEFSAELPEDAIVLAEIDIAGRGACQVGAEDGSATATLLEEVGKALGSAELALEEREYAFQMVRSALHTDQRGMRVRSDSVVQLLYTWPIKSLAATRLRDGGFVQRRSASGLELQLSDAYDSYVWFGPDAATLMSPPFLETHCFRLARDPRDTTRIGLSFAPARGRSKSDISGTLWVDRRTLAVRALNYEYVNVPSGFPRKGAHGSIEFLRLPNGLWLVSRWMIRAPIEMVRGSMTVGIAGWVDDGGYIREIRRTDGALVYAAPPRGE